MEYLQVFDINQNMLDEKILRSNKRNIEDNKYFMIILNIIENDEGKLLIQLTSKEKDSVYALTGGHVEVKEDGLTTCLRETKEELGITLNKDEVKLIGTKILPKIILNVYYTKKNIDINKLTLQTSEVEKVCWMTLEDINKLKEENKLRQSNIPAFEMLADYKSKEK